MQLYMQKPFFKYDVNTVQNYFLFQFIFLIEQCLFYKIGIAYGSNKICTLKCL